MSTFTSALLALIPLASLATAQLEGQAFNIYPTSACDDSGYYTQMYLGDGYPACDQATFSDPNFPNDSAGYPDVYIEIPAPPATCQVFVRAPSDVTNPNCGDPIFYTLPGTASHCAKVTLKQPFDFNWCCGEDDCNSALTTSQKRMALPLPAPEPEAVPKKQVRGNPRFARNAGSSPDGHGNWNGTALREDSRPDGHKSWNRTAPEPLTKRADCAYTGGDQYTTDGTIGKVSDTINCLSDSTACHQNFQTTVETSTSSTFEVSESTEASLFDLVSETLTLSYSFTYEESYSNAQTITYDVPPGTSGYLSFTPTLICKDGSFGGDNCAVPTGQQGTACVPSFLADGKTVDGTVNYVQVG